MISSSSSSLPPLPPQIEHIGEAISSTGYLGEREVSLATPSSSSANNSSSSSSGLGEVMYSIGQDHGLVSSHQQERIVSTLRSVEVGNTLNELLDTIPEGALSEGAIPLPDWIEGLPFELWVQVFKCLTLSEAICLSKTCRLMHNLFYSPPLRSYILERIKSSYEDLEDIFDFKNLKETIIADFNALLEKGTLSEEKAKILRKAIEHANRLGPDVGTLVRLVEITVKRLCLEEIGKYVFEGEAREVPSFRNTLGLGVQVSETETNSYYLLEVCFENLLKECKEEEARLREETSYIRARQQRFDTHIDKELKELLIQVGIAQNVPHFLSYCMVREMQGQGRVYSYYSSGGRDNSKNVSFFIFWCIQKYFSLVKGSNDFLVILQALSIVELDSQGLKKLGGLVGDYCLFYRDVPSFPIVILTRELLLLGVDIDEPVYRGELNLLQILFEPYLIPFSEKSKLLQLLLKMRVNINVRDSSNSPVLKIAIEAVEKIRQGVPGIADVENSTLIRGYVIQQVKLIQELLRHKPHFNPTSQEGINILSRLNNLYDRFAQHKESVDGKMKLKETKFELTKSSFQLQKIEEMKISLQEIEVIMTQLQALRKTLENHIESFPVQEEPDSLDDLREEALISIQVFHAD